MADDKKNPKEASNIFHSIMKASVRKAEIKRIDEKLSTLEEYNGPFENPTNEQLEILSDAMDAAFKLFFKEDPTGTSKIKYGGISIIPIDDSADIKELFTKIILIYAKAQNPPVV